MEETAEVKAVLEDGFPSEAAVQELHHRIRSSRVVPLVQRLEPRPRTTPTATTRPATSRPASLCWYPRTPRSWSRSRRRREPLPAAATRWPRPCTCVPRSRRSRTPPAGPASAAPAASRCIPGPCARSGSRACRGIIRTHRSVDCHDGMERIELLLKTTTCLGCLWPLMSFCPYFLQMKPSTIVPLVTSLVAPAPRAL